MVLNNIHILPIFIFILIPSSFLITYSIAISLGHIEIGFPYISDTGTYVPESCIFSQAINLVSFTLAIFMYIQYKHVEQHCRDHLSSEYTIVLKLNKLAILVGLCGCFGVSVLANFQELNVIVVHMTGALMAFGCAASYSWIQTVISYFLCPLLNSSFIAKARLSLSLVLTAAFATTLVAGVIAHTKFHGEDVTKWKPGDGGFVEHVISTGAEWILVICFDFFILTYAKEMKCISLSSPQVHFVTHDISLQNNDDHLAISTSQNSFRSLNSVPPSVSDSGHTTRANVH